MATKSREELEEKLRAYVGVDIGPPWVAKYPVNQAMIGHFCAAVGDTNPAYLDSGAAARTVHGGVVAPPTMMDAWTMPGMGAAWVHAEGVPQDKQIELHRLLDEYGYTGVVGTNQEQEYKRYLRPGDQLTARIVIEAISEQKATPLGLGYFVTTRYTFRDQNGEEVGSMLFRVMKFKPAQQPAAATTSGDGAAAAAPRRLRPPLGHDNAWWWEGINRGQLLIQKCSSCGALRHPPRPMCGKCQSSEWTSIASRGRGRVYSFTILHHPKFPGFDFPVACGLIELEEGTRLVSNVVGCEPDAVFIGMPVKLSIENVDEEMKLPLFRPAGAA